MAALTRDIAEMASDVWRYRELLFAVTSRDIRIRYKQAIMGFGWAILMPALIVLSGIIVRFAVAYLSGGSLDRTAVATVSIKALPWAFFVGAIGFANASLIGNINLVTKIYFPREVLPMAAVFAQAFDTAVGAVAVAAVLPLLGVRPSIQLLWLPGLAVLLVAFTAAVALLVSCGALFFRDVKYLVQVALTFGIFFTPVFFEPQMFGELGAKLMMLNPLAPMMEGVRLVVVEQHNLLSGLSIVGSRGAIPVWSPWYLGYAAGWALGGLVFGALVFHRLEFLFAEYA